jgi:hypothetical protein
MPYITQEAKQKFDLPLEHAARRIYDKEELTYCIYKLGVEVLKDLDPNYSNLAMIKSAMNDAADKWLLDKMLEYSKKEKRLNKGKDGG